jgi:hypothetical protein
VHCKDSVKWEVLVTEKERATEDGAPPTPEQILLAHIGQRQSLTTGWVDGESATALVKIGDRMMPNRIDANFPGADGQPSLDLAVEVFDGAPRCTDLRFTRVEGGRPVRTSDLNAIQLNQWVDDLAAMFAIPVTGRVGQQLFGGPAATEQMRASADLFVKSRRAGDRRKVTEERVQRAVQIYIDNFEDHPTDAVAREMGIERSMASRLLTLARKRKTDGGFELLPKGTPGKKTK